MFAAIVEGAFDRWFLAAVDEKGRKERLRNAFVSPTP
jgi:hypothetical protein